MSCGTHFLSSCCSVLPKDTFSKEARGVNERAFHLACSVTELTSLMGPGETFLAAFLIFLSVKIRNKTFLMTTSTFSTMDLYY